MIKQWNCIADVAKEFNKPTTLFTNCCIRKSGYKSAYGYQWRYTDDCDDISQIHYQHIEVDEINDNGNILHHFNSIQEAMLFYNDDKLRIYDTCYGKQKSTHGHKFRFSKRE